MIDLSDPISRQQAITALRALSDEDGYINAPHEVVTDVVRGLPPVQAKQGQTAHSEQPKTDKFGVKTSETYKDTISRQAAIDFVGGMEMCDVISAEAYKELTNYFEDLPTAQQDIIRCKDCKYRDENWRRVSVRWLPCMEIRTGSNWYCGSAERREDG